jgi:hypothetical protein
LHDGVQDLLEGQVAADLVSQRKLCLLILCLEALEPGKYLLVLLHLIRLLCVMSWFLLLTLVKVRIHNTLERCFYPDSVDQLSEAEPRLVHNAKAGNRHVNRLLVDFCKLVATALMAFILCLLRVSGKLL